MSSNMTQDNVRNAVVLFTICIPGFILNLFSSIALLRHRSLRNPFFKLVAFHTVSNTLMVFLLLIFSAPQTLLRYESELLLLLNHRVGQLSIFFQECSYHICFFISLNRFLAIGKPLLSRRVFNDRTTNYIMIFTVGYCSILFIIYFLPGCNFTYDTTTNIWSFDDTFCGYGLAFIDLYYNVGMFTISCTIDMITLFLLRGANERIYKTMMNSSREEANRRQRKEILFFSQALLITIIYCFTLFTFHVLRLCFDDNFYIFLCTTAAWGLAHASGGLIVIMFNSEIRNSLLCWKHSSRKSNMVTVCAIQSQQTV